MGVFNGTGSMFYSTVRTINTTISMFIRCIRSDEHEIRCVYRFRKEAYYLLLKKLSQILRYECFKNYVVLIGVASHKGYCGISCLCGDNNHP